MTRLEQLVQQRSQTLAGGHAGKSSIRLAEHPHLADPQLRIIDPLTRMGRFDRDDAVGRIREEAGELVGRVAMVVEHGDVRARLDCLVDELRLEAGHQRGHDDHEAATDRDAGDRDAGPEGVVPAERAWPWKLQVACRLVS